jgi:hypothetical protein
MTGDFQKEAYYKHAYNVFNTVFAEWPLPAAGG